MSVLRARWVWVVVVVVLAAGAAGGWYGWTQTRDEGGSPEAYCALVADRGRFEQAVEGFDPADVTRSIEQLRRAREQLAELRDVAPSELHDDLDTQIGAIDTLLTALEAVDPADSVAAVEALDAAEAELQDVLAATMRLEAWTRENCPVAQA